MSHYRRDDDEEPEPEEAEDMEGGRGGRKRRRCQFIDDVAEEEEEDDGDFGGGGGCRAKRRPTAEFFDDIAAAASDDEEEIDDGDDDFIVEPVADLQDGDDCRRNHRRPLLSREDDMIAGLSTLFANRKKDHLMKGDQVIVVKGDLKNLKGWVEKVEEDNVQIRPNVEGLPKTLAVNEKELCKYFKPGNHVKVVSGASEGAAGMVVKVEGHVVIILSDTTKEHIRVFADNVVESSEVTTGVTRIGDYELHDLVMLDNMSFGVIIRVETEAFQILKGVPERPEVALIRLREIKSKLERKNFAQDQSKNRVSVKDVVSILEGPYRGKQGPVEHIFRGILFIYDRHHLGHAGFICAKSQSCILVGGSHMNGDRNGGSLASRYAHLRSPACVPQSPGRFPRGPPMECIGRHGGGRGHDPLVGTTVKVRQGPFKGYRGCVVDDKGLSVRV